MTRWTDELLFSSKNNEWGTPRHFFEKLVDMFGEFTLDPCATEESAKANKYYTKEDDGLAQDWSNELVFMNPPYNRYVGLWMEKAVDSSFRGATVVCLVYARTDTKWWHDYVMPHADRVYFVRGRLKFVGADNSAPAPSTVIVFRPTRTPGQTMHSMDRD